MVRGLWSGLWRDVVTPGILGQAGTSESHEVFNLVPVRALPDADFAGFPDVIDMHAFRT